MKDCDLKARAYVDWLELKEKVESANSLETYLSGEYDKSNCILEIHSGAGGTESCDWALMLYRMYTRYLSRNGYKYEEIDRQPGELIVHIQFSNSILNRKKYVISNTLSRLGFKRLEFKIALPIFLLVGIVVCIILSN